MKVTLEIKTVKEQWQPPFKKDSKIEQYTVEEGDFFLPMQGKPDEFVFRLVSVNSYGVVLEFDHEYMPRSFDAFPNHQIRMGYGDETIFTAKWSHNGVIYYIKPMQEVMANNGNGTESLMRSEEGILEAKEETPTEMTLPTEDSLLENLK